MRAKRFGIALAVSVVAVLLFVFADSWSGGTSLSCNGSAALCDRAYNQVSYLTSHNAMSSSKRGFVQTEQEPDIVGQLDEGVRGLMLDLHTWTTQAQAAPVLAELAPSLRAGLDRLIQSSPPRPGVWLCHEICQIGADPAVAQLARVRGWLAQHPDEVVTLILEDDVPFTDVQSTLKAAGLDPWLATPPARGGAWPTLRQMVDHKQTLMVFTQNAKPDLGPVRNFYQLAAETPFQAASAAALSCAPDRGGATAPLFLINNWVTQTIPTKAVARTVNDPTFLGNRVRRCDAERGMLANFVAVDFSDTGNPLEVVQELNGTGSPLP